jgi:AcrR family transcriptional regulator
VISHRSEVREAILDAAGELVHSAGPIAVTMSRIAEVVGIGRATLYKYFPDVEHVLSAWHERQISAHLSELASLGNHASNPADRLRAVLSGYARICADRGRHGEWGAALHRGEAMVTAQQRLHDLMTGLVSEAAATGTVRADMPASLLASYCLHALTAASDTGAGTDAALVDVVWAGLACRA